MSDTTTQPVQPSGSVAPITGEGPVTKDTLDPVPIRCASQIVNILDGVHDYWFGGYTHLGWRSLVFASITECDDEGGPFMGPAGLAIYSVTPVTDTTFPAGLDAGHVELKINNTWGTTLRCRIAIMWSEFGG